MAKMTAKMPDELMAKLKELNTLLDSLNLPVETGAFSNKAPDTYIVLTPLIDVFDIYADNRPEVDVQEVRISLFTKHNYLETVYKILFSLFNQDFTITEKRYIEHEDDTGYHHYAIDVAKHYLFPKEEDET